MGAITHLEKVAVERAGGASHDIWDVHCAGVRWWAVREPSTPTQEDFKKPRRRPGLPCRPRDRAAEQRRQSVYDEAADLLPGPWRRRHPASDATPGIQEAEDFQAIGMRLRECPISFASEELGGDLVPAGGQAAKAADFVGWADLLVDNLAPGPGAEHRRSYLPKLTRETWDYVN